MASDWGSGYARGVVSPSGNSPWIVPEMDARPPLNDYSIEELARAEASSPYLRQRPDIARLETELSIRRRESVAAMLSRGSPDAPNVVSASRFPFTNSEPPSPEPPGSPAGLFPGGMQSRLIQPLDRFAFSSRPSTSTIVYASSAPSLISGDELIDEQGAIGRGQDRLQGRLVLTPGSVKEEAGAGVMDEDVPDDAYNQFHRLFESFVTSPRTLMDVADLVRQCAHQCRSLSDSLREASADRHRLTELHLMKQESELLRAEAATWALIYELYGKEPANMYSPLEGIHILSPPTSQQVACEFICKDPQAQLLLRIVEWLEGLASYDLDCQEQKTGMHVFPYFKHHGARRNTRQALQSRAARNSMLVRSLDPDATSREQGCLDKEDQEQEEKLLQDVWKLLKAGRLREARDLCRQAGQSWRAALLGGCGDAGPSPSLEKWRDANVGREGQALEMARGLGRQRRLWKWATYCASEKIATDVAGSKYEAATLASMCGNLRRLLPVCTDWESALWAAAKAWLDTMVDLHLQGGRIAEDPPGGPDLGEKLAGAGRPHSWPRQVLDQQPPDLESLFQRLHVSKVFAEAVRRDCKDPQHMIQMNLIMDNIDRVLDLLRRLIGSPGEARPTCHPQMMRFGAHLVFALRAILPHALRSKFNAKLSLSGNVILSTYAAHLLERGKEDLVALYASQMAPLICVDVYSSMMDLRESAPEAVKYRIFAAALRRLPFFPTEGHGSFSEILDTVMTSSREYRPPSIKADSVYDHRKLDALRKARAVRWLCFAPPEDIEGADIVQAELFARALDHSNTLFREIALGSLGRDSEHPMEAHLLRESLALSLAGRTADELLAASTSFGPEIAQELIEEHQDWIAYLNCEDLYREWVRLDERMGQLVPEGPSKAEGELVAAAATRALEAGLALLQSEGSAWLDVRSGAEVNAVPKWVELHAMVTVVNSSGETFAMDAGSCATLQDSFLTYVGPSAIVSNALKVDVRTHTEDPSVVEVRFRCQSMAAPDNPTSPAHDDCLLAKILAAGIKGELPHFTQGVALRAVRVDSWLDTDKGQLAAPSVARKLCRLCCLPNIVLRCLEMRMHLASSRGLPADDDSRIIQCITSPEAPLFDLFTRHQMQEALQMETEAMVTSMEVLEPELASF